MIRRENDGVDWEMSPEFADRLNAVLRAPGEAVKASPVKRVTRHRLEGRVYYVKRYRHASVPLRSWKYLFRPTQAREEWELARALEEKGVPAVRHVALGERRTWSGVQESILVTEGFDGVPLEEAPGTDPRAVLAFVQRVHAAGVLQRDLHPGNLLVRERSGEPPEIRLVDLHGAVLKAALTAEERDRNLARLAVSFDLPVGAAIRAEAAALRRRLWFERSRRCLRRNRDFAPVRIGRLRWWARTAALTDAARRIMAEPDTFLATRAKLLKPGRSSTVGLGDGLVLKRYNLRKWANLLKDWVRPSKARRAYRKAYHLELAGIRTARVVATADRRVAGWLWRSYVLMEAIPDAVELGRFVKGRPRLEPELVWQVAELVGRLHREGMTHRDMKETNLVLDSQQQLHLLDLDGLEFVDELSPARARADLARLARGLEQCGVEVRRYRFRFLRRYLRVVRGEAEASRRAR